MKRWSVFFSAFSCQGLSLIEDDIDLVAQTFCAPSKRVEVTQVYDGDTIKYWNDAIESESTVRLLGVAAPEVATSDSSAECYGDESKDFLRGVILYEEVELQYDVECTDLFGRELAWIVFSDSDPQIADWQQSLDLWGTGNGAIQSTETVTTDQELLVNELIVRLGYAEVFQGEVDQSIRYREQMALAESSAEIESLGLHSQTACE